MNIIKLSAINSTNDYLKSLASAQHLKNFTIVTAEAQTQGKGQMGGVWNAEAGKNLTFSILLKDLLRETSGIFTLNVAVVTAIAKAVSGFDIPDISIKWPNDILAGNKKICGVLIENSIKSDGKIQSVVGIGINVNQTDFKGLPKASSMAVQADKFFDKEEIMLAIAHQLQQNVSDLETDAQMLWRQYHDLLFKKGIPMPFEKEGRRFMGIIQKVTENGQLEILLEDQSLAYYGIKEVQLLY
jgi:BirA family biotin operon repressor/biotin-[acetyl-CoA-carboxylase] ligase